MNSIQHEIDRLYDVIDMQLTGHSILRDRYNRIAVFMDLSLLGISIVLCAMTFFDPSLLQAFNMQPHAVQIITGIASILVFFISVTGLRVDWKQKAAQHAEAAKNLGVLKYKHRLMQNDTVITDENFRKFHGECACVFDNIEKIPDSQFCKLKQIHKRKVLASKMISKYPYCPRPLMTIYLMCKDTKSLLGSKIDELPK